MDKGQRKKKQRRVAILDFGLEEAARDVRFAQEVWRICRR
jgi:hypothetical protein